MISWHAVYVLLSFSAIFCLADLTHRPGSPDCQLKVHNWEYNICPIIKGPGRTVEYESFTPNSSIKTAYEFNLGGPRETDECPNGTWICISVYESHQSVEPPALTRTTWSCFPADNEFISEDQGLSLTLRFRCRSNTSRLLQASIHFVCDDNTLEPTAPSFLEYHAGVHRFIWTTRYACGRNIARADLTSSSTNFSLMESEDILLDDEEDGDEGQDLRDAMPISGSSGRSIISIIVFLSGSVMIILGVLFYSPPAPIRQVVDSYVVKPLQFRVGEHNLLRWPEEDSILGDEEDVMVNSVDDQDDEHIPLKPSPRKNFLVNYGSALV